MSSEINKMKSTALAIKQSTLFIVKGLVIFNISSFEVLMGLVNRFE